MYFITCFSEAWYQERMVFAGLAPQFEATKKPGTSRTFGYFERLEDAIDAVLNNCGDLHEGLHTLCVIENQGPGVHPELTHTEYWFRWDALARARGQGPWRLGAWTPLKSKPEACQNQVCFAIG